MGEQFAKNNTDIGRDLESLEDLETICSFPKGSKSPAFYWYEHENPGLGFKYLITKAFQMQEDARTITDGEAQFTSTICNLLLCLSTKERSLFADCMKWAVDSKTPGLSILEKTRMPVSTQDFDNFYLKNNKRAVLQNLSQEMVMKHDGYALISLIDVIVNMTASGTSVDQL